MSESKKLFSAAIVGWSLFLLAMIAVLDMHLTISHQERMLEIKDSRIEVAHKSIGMLEEHVAWWQNEAYGVLEDLQECKIGE